MEGMWRYYTWRSYPKPFNWSVCPKTEKVWWVQPLNFHLFCGKLVCPTQRYARLTQFAPRQWGGKSNNSIWQIEGTVGTVLFAA